MLFAEIGHTVTALTYAAGLFAIAVGGAWAVRAVGVNLHDLRRKHRADRARRLGAAPASAAPTAELEVTAAAGAAAGCRALDCTVGAAAA